MGQTATIYVYIGRDNVEAYDLLQNGELVTPSSVTKATFTFGDYSINTDDDATLIELTENATRVEFAPGLIEDLEPGFYDGHLTVYDALAPEGIAWEYFSVDVRAWPVE